MKPSKSGPYKLCNRRLLALFCACFLLGVFLSFDWNAPRFLWVFPPLMLLALLFYERAFRLSVSILSLAFCLFGLLRGEQVFYADRPALVEKSVLSGTISSVDYHSHNRSRYILKNASYDRKKLDAKAELTVYGDFVAMPGDNVRCTVKLHVIETYDDAEFDYRTWRLSQGVAYQGAGSKAENLGPNGGLPYFFTRFAGRLEDTLNQMYGERAGMAVGMTLGNTDQMSDEQLEVFRAAGIAHVLSVSGLNFAFFMVALQWILGKRTYLSHWRFFLTLFLLWSYCAVVGWPASAVRACLMLSLYLLAQWAGWKYDLLTSILVAAAVIALVRPAQLFAAGFTLSFSATLGIAMFYKPMAKRLCRFEKLPRAVAQSLSVWASAQIGILPFMVLYFRTVQLYGAIANLLVVPLSSIVTVGGLISGLLGLVFFPLAKAVAFCVGLVCVCIEAVAKFIAILPAAQITIETIPAPVFVTWYMVAFIYSRYCLLPKRTKWAISGSAALVTGAVLLL